MSKPKEPRIFLSYASPNLETAWKVYNYLTENGYSVWFDKKDLRQGHDWAEGITRGVDACTLILVLISQHSNHNLNVRSEVNLASQRRLEMKGVLLEELVLSSHLNYHLSAVQFVNAHQVIEKDWLRNLNSALRAFHPMGYQDSIEYVEPIIEDPIPPSLTALNAGTKLRDNRYQVVSLLGQGHFGMTYICTDAHMTDRKVVVKEYVKDAGRWEGKTKLIPFEDKSESFQKGLSKFAEEARRLTQITDVGQNMPYIPHIYDFFQENGTAYYVMPYYQGQNLWAKIQEGRRPIALKEALNLLTPVLDALSYLHGQNFLHRDLKPDNLFRTKAGKNLPATTILIDFGLAREMVDGYGMSSGFVGALGFAPPEQLIAGEPQGAWTDVYAFTGTLFCLVTGKFPNKEHGNWNRMDFGTPDLVTLRFRALLNKGMAKSRKDRYTDITALRTDWEALVQSFDEAEEEAKRQKIAQQVTNAENLMHQKALREAITLLESIRKIAPDHEKVSELLVEARLQQRLEEAAKEQAAKKKARLEKLLQAAKTAFKRQDYQTAQTNLHTLLHEAPDHAEASDILKAVEAQIKAEQAQADAARRQQEAEAAARNKQLEAEKQAALEAAEREKAEKAEQARRQQEAEAVRRQQQAQADDKIKPLEPVKPEPTTPVKPTSNQTPKPPKWKRWAGIALFAGAGLWGLNSLTPDGETPLTPNAKTETITPSTQSQPRLWTNSIGMQFVRIAKGSFMMGSPNSDQEASYDEKDQKRVNITKDFYMGQYEVTQDEFGAFVSATGYQTEAEKDGGCYIWNGSSWNIEANKNWRTVFVGGKRPVVCVSHNDALAYINWLNQKEGTNTYRLPTEAEWEYAARAGSSSKYSFGDDAAQLCQYGNLADASTDFSWRASCNDGVGKETAVVGRYRANAWGLYDMHGNVWEWVQDWYQGDYYKNSPSNDPSNLTKNSNTHRVLRGGSWYLGPQLLRSAYRGYDGPAGRRLSIGFRLSKTL